MDSQRTIRKTTQPKALLVLQSYIVRRAMDFAMLLDRHCSSHIPSPSFCRIIPATTSPRKGSIELLFYTPAQYATAPKISDKRYPVVVNFHGGGFAVGRASDDARWAATVVDIVDAVLVCVNYRLAPECCFPTAVDDGVDTILYLGQKAQELRIDPHRMALSGFSSGGTMTFTVPFRLNDKLRQNKPQHGIPSKEDSCTILAIVSWYPPTDFATCTREERRKSNPRPQKELPRFLTKLFDASYIRLPQGVSLSHPYLSPALAPDKLLRELPDEVLIFTCEWDGLCREAERFRDHLREDLGKSVHGNMIEGVRHAWDKCAISFRGRSKRNIAYMGACAWLDRRLRPW